MKKLLCIALFAGMGLLHAQPGAATVIVASKTFDTPEEARDALVQATGQGLDALRELFGTGSKEILLTGDPIEDKSVLLQFKARVTQKTQLDADEMNPNRYTLLIGDEAWPFAVPLIRKNGKWFWDTKEGRAEVRRRVIGGNELDAIQVCRGYVEAQEMYATTDWQGKGILQYAAKIASTPGMKDGLYWPGTESPISENIARAIAQGYSAPGAVQRGYHGYYYKVLMAQGPAADGGEQDYVVHGYMIGGFALVAWPVDYGISGIMSFIVNQDGDVYQKDLGSQTGTLAKAMTKFNPDKTWTIVPDDAN